MRSRSKAVAIVRGHPFTVLFIGGMALYFVAFALKGVIM